VAELIDKIPQALSNLLDKPHKENTGGGFQNNTPD
jgi:hypothetical protein